MRHKKFSNCSLQIIRHSSSRPTNAFFVRNPVSVQALPPIFLMAPARCIAAVYPDQKIVEK